MKLSLNAIAAFQKNLLNWYGHHHRQLPFRKTKDPYRIWLSEIMLQQTTVAAVLDYYDRFTKRFPTLHSVAQAPPEELLHAWQGLGYYARIRNFQTACRQVQSEYGGRIPQDFDALKKLKGIGDYTAAALASICFDRPHAVVDGNVKRVLARLFNYRDPSETSRARAFFTEKADALLNKKNPGDHNQALMELGAVVCRPQPACALCPVSVFCEAKGQNPQRLPVKKKQRFKTITYAALLLADENGLVLKKPHPDNLIADMWELPLITDPTCTDPVEHWRDFFHNRLHPDKMEQIGSVRHGITDKKITTLVYRHPLIKPRGSEFQTLRLKALADYPINTLSKKILKKFSV